MSSYDWPSSLSIRPILAEFLVHVALALKIALVEDPGIAALGVRENLPVVAVQVDKMKAIGPVGGARFAHLGDAPFLGLFVSQAVRLIHVGIVLDIDAVVVQVLREPVT